ncbi:hypothetical protein [Bradyrhizobium niftali]|jgi:hypothetical protein|uniref:Transmembrane protein n=1 Tax=Bradyrhizobium niftali TaxID=2560055 RepID=A0A4Y9LRQ6_9BRAD|nr:hypothetical protein [Bradyrhizobium niftali]TFV45194.1 hypothetical protein E4K65_24290 [Bradyrhizobium niftali]
MILRWLRGISGAALIGLGVLFALAFEARYWRWRNCFNELGRCYDPVSQDVYLEQAGMVWGGLAAISLLVGLGLVMGLRRRPS